MVKPITCGEKAIFLNCHPWLKCNVHRAAETMRAMEEDGGPSKSNAQTTLRLQQPWGTTYAPNQNDCCKAGPAGMQR